MIDGYPYLRPLLFLFSPERALRLSMLLLKIAPAFCCPKLRDDPVILMGITFPNRIGLAAGLDDNADYVDVLAKLGIGFIEVGGVTPRPVYVDYKDLKTLKQLVDREGRILPRRRTGTSALYQRAVRQAVMRARFIGLLPYVSAD